MFKAKRLIQGIALFVFLQVCPGSVSAFETEMRPVPDPSDLPDFRLQAEAWLNGCCYQDYIAGQLAEFAEYYPKTLAYVGEERVRLFIAMSMCKGDYYNLFAEREIGRLYVMMLDLGSGFDADPLYPWARFPVFAPKDYTEDMPESWAYMLKKWEEYLGFVRATAGERFQHALRAARRVGDLRFSEIAELTDERSIKLLQRLYPERFARVPEEVVRGELMQLAEEKAGEYGMPTRTGKTLMLTILFSCGSDADKNPLYEVLFEGLQEMPARGLNKERELFRRCQHFVKIIGR